MSFKKRPYQIEMYADFPRIEGADICKAVQTGQSEMFSVFGIHDAGWLGRIFAYVMPTDRIRDRFVSTRINQLLSSVQAYRERLPGADLHNLETGDSGSLRKKRLGAGLMLFLGAKTDGDFIELTADTFVVDEFDVSKAMGPHNLERVIDRIKESPDPKHFRLGNAEMPGGIVSLYERGDMRLFHWRCSHCGHRQPIDWLTSVVDRLDSGQWVLRDHAARNDDRAPVRPVCLKCGRPFERDADGAAWVPLQPLRDRRSYRVTRFDVMSEPLRRLWTEWIDAQSSVLKIREWYRRNAAILYQEASSKVTEEQLRHLACLEFMDHAGGEHYKNRRITAGIDVGALIHVTISESIRAPGGHVERPVRWVGTVQTKDQVIDLLRRFWVKTCVIDNDPETRMVEEIQERAIEFGCVVWLCRFHPQPRTTQQRFGMTQDSYAGTVRVDRTQAFDVATEHLHAGARMGEVLARVGEKPSAGIDGVRLYPRDVTDLQGWLSQMTAPERMTVDGRIVWFEGDKEDHYRLSDLYDLVAWELDGHGAVVINIA